MYRSYVVVAALAGLLAAAPIATWACKAAGENVHVGKLMKVNVEAKSFTIFDVETANAITFVSDEPTLRSLQGVRGMVQVRYEQVGDALRAIDVRY